MNPKARAFLFLAIFTTFAAFSLHGWAAPGQILLNPSFEQNSGQAVPTGWTYFKPPTVPNSTRDYWIGGPPTGGFPATPHSGSLYWKEWGAGYFQPPVNNVAGIQQTLGSSPGSVYQAKGFVYSSTGDSIGSPSFQSYAFLEVSFLDANSNKLALFTSAPFSQTTGLDQWVELDVTNACDLTSPLSTGDPYYTNYAVKSTVSQLVAPNGTTQIRYRFAYLQAGNEGGSCYFDDAALLQASGSIAPIVSNVFPQNMIFVPPSNGLTFNAVSTSGATINASGVKVVLNGLDVSSNLTVTGPVSNRLVSYSGLQSNMTYSATISVTDASGLTASTTNYFETTWVGTPPILYLWEAEDFDFNSGMYIDYPDLCTSAGDTNCYFGQVGTPGVDEQSHGESVSHLYRNGDAMNIDVSGDLLRPNLFRAGRTDYELNPFESGEWVNYTRDFTNGTYWIIARLATDINFSGSITMSILDSNAVATPLGSFAITNGLGWTTFLNVFLTDTNGNKVNVPLKGKMTLQATSGGNLLPNFFALVPAIVDQPIISGMYPTGTQPFEYTNALSFNVASIGATFPSNGIDVMLDGFDVSSSLQLAGPASNRTVVLPGLLLNAIHTAVISVTNSLGHGFRITNNFDTFSQSNYMVEAEDFDYGNDQFVSPWFPDAYQGLDSTSNIDYFHTTITGEQFPYRQEGIPEEIARDFLRADFVDSGAFDYHLAWFGAGDWANYTRSYPPGSYYVYVRTAGLGAFTMYLQQIVNGVGTANQTVKTLGQWSGSGPNNQAHEWVELTDAGLSAPQLVTLTGTNTLRILTTTGDCYPNYFMLVPAAGVGVAVSKASTNATISFPTQAGVVYRVFYRDAIGSGAWNLLTSVLGNGATQSINVAPSNAARFYKIEAP
jgi:hypothetical protein